MRTVTFFVDNYGNLCRRVQTQSCWFWYPAYFKKEFDLVMSWGNYDEWGSLKEKANETTT